MSLASAIAGFFGQVTIMWSGVPFLTFDCSVSESHNREATPTEFEIENGQVISDHIIIKPFKLKLTGIISDSPLTGIGAIAKNAVTTTITKTANNPGVLGAKASAISALPLIPNPFSPSRDAYQSLLNLQAARIPVQVITSLYVYNNMWVTSISVPREARTGRALAFDVTLSQLLLVSPISVDISKFALANLAAGQANKGAEAAEEKSAAEAAAAAGYKAGLGLTGAN